MYGRQELKNKLISLAAQSPKQRQSQAVAAPPADLRVDFRQSPFTVLSRIDQQLWLGTEEEVMQSLGNFYRESIEKTLLKPGAKHRLFFSLVFESFWPVDEYRRLVSALEKKDVTDYQYVLWGCEDCLLKIDESISAGYNHKLWLEKKLNYFHASKQLRNNLLITIGDLAKGPAYMLIVETAPDLKGLFVAARPSNGFFAVRCHCFYFPPSWEEVDFEQPLSLTTFSTDKVRQLISAKVPCCEKTLMPLPYLFELAVFIVNRSLQLIDAGGRPASSLINDYVDDEIKTWTNVFKKYGPSLPLEAQQRLCDLYTLKDSPTTIDISEAPAHLRAPFAVVTLSRQRSTYHPYRLANNLARRPLIFRMIIHREDEKGVASDSQAFADPYGHSANFPVLLRAKLELDSTKIPSDAFTGKLPWRPLGWKEDEEFLAPHSNKTVVNLIRSLKKLAWHTFYVLHDFTILKCVEENDAQFVKAVNRAEKNLDDWLRRVINNPELPAPVKKLLIEHKSHNNTVIPILVHGPNGARAIFIMPRQQYCGGSGLLRNVLAIGGYSLMDDIKYGHIPTPYLNRRLQNLMIIVWLPGKKPRILRYTSRHRALGKGPGGLMHKLFLPGGPVEKVQASWHKLWSIGKTLETPKM